jgi:alpha-N-arabinofuranosidase
VLRTRIACDTYDTAYFDPAGMDDEVRTPLTGVPYLKLAAVSGDAGELTLFALNRELTSEMRLEVTTRGFDGLVVTGATTLHDADLKAANTRDAQNRIKPATLTGVSAKGGTIVASLPSASWSVIRLAPANA